MKVYRGISPLELRAIRCSGFILSGDSQWVADLTWQSHQTRTFFSRNKEQADLFAIGAYIGGYGATGQIIQRYLIGRRDRLIIRAYTLKVNIAKSLLRSDTEFAARGDDELYTTEPIPVRYIQNLYIHRVWLSSIEDNGVFVVSAFTTELPLKLPLVSTELTADSAPLSQNYPLQDRRFWLKVSSTDTYVCVATLFNGVLSRYEIPEHVS